MRMTAVASLGERKRRIPTKRCMEELKGMLDIVWRTGFRRPSLGA